MAAEAAAAIARTATNDATDANDANDANDDVFFTAQERRATGSVARTSSGIGSPVTSSTQ